MPTKRHPLAGRVHGARALLALALAGCFSYVPTQTAPRPGTEVRVTLTPDGMTALTRYLGPRVIALDGRVTGRGSDSGFTVAVTMLQMVDGTRQQWSGEAPVELPPVAVASVAERTLNRRRSWIVGSAATASLVAIGAAAIRASRGKSGGGDGGPPPPPP